MEIVLHLVSMEVVLVAISVTALKDGLVIYVIKVIYTVL